MTAALPPERHAEIVAALRAAGARFGFLHGSRAAGTHRPDSDGDVVAWWGSTPAGLRDRRADRD